MSTFTTTAAAIPMIQEVNRQPAVEIQRPQRANPCEAPVEDDEVAYSMVEGRNHERGDRDQGGPPETAEHKDSAPMARPMSEPQPE